jgi:riboflavin synthase
MFTGIVAAIGKIVESQALEDGIRITVATDTLGLDDVGNGDSIACNGVCLTVINVSADRFTVDVSRETLNCTVGLEGGSELNLEKALRLADRLGGHLVSGHVDGVGTVLKFEPIGESHELVIRAPTELAKYISRKGSITINGVSLTTNRVDGADFSINLIPHTIEVTTLKHLAPGSRVNLEVDLIARYVERMLASQSQDNSRIGLDPASGGSGLQA